MQYILNASKRKAYVLNIFQGWFNIYGYDYPSDEAYIALKQAVFAFSGSRVIEDRRYFWIMKGQDRKIIGVNLKWIRLVAIYQNTPVFIILSVTQLILNGIVSPEFPSSSGRRK